ncbi:MAG: SIS domain-containing protein [SAR86 cluster bacterium]|jgi:D-sedoheptulose 7-phosphate isomerase|nr:SIS domain-containing protein [SAR86 cluster bacterium]|tara:strand:+ start:11511 stop:12074 length:564 start_codon:yes stop_codon:yes gene_type:complete
MDKDFLKDYFKGFSQLVEPNEDMMNNLLLLKEKIIETQNKGCKTLIFGNGGSAAMASHFSVDLTKNAGVRCSNFNEADLITCFANDYGFENWIAKAIEFYGDPGDLLILISSSGNSVNMLNAAETAKSQNFSGVATFSGFLSDNPLRKSGDINIWVDSTAYNYVENIHQMWLLSLVDLIIGDAHYSA